MKFLSDSLTPLLDTRYSILTRIIDSLFSYLEQSSDAFEVKNNEYDLRIMEMNAYRSELNDAYLKRLQADIYLDEAYHVLIDFINLGKN